MSILTRRPDRNPAAANPIPPDPDLFAVERLTPGALTVHAIGGVLNAAGIVLGLLFLASRLDALADGWWIAVLAFLAASYVADFVSGLLHWGFDTWFSENTVVRRMVVRVREHHAHPNRIFRYGFLEDGGLLAWFAVACSAPALAVAWWGDALPLGVRCAFAVAALTVAIELELMAELHKIGHRVNRGRVVRALQRAHLLLSPEHHLKHHSGAHDTHYCLVNGWADDTLGRLGVFRGLERVVVAVVPKLDPRANDLEWQRRARG